MLNWFKKLWCEKKSMMIKSEAWRNPAINPHTTVGVCQYLCVCWDKIGSLLRMHRPTVWSCCIIPSMSKKPRYHGVCNFIQALDYVISDVRLLIPSCVGFVVWSALYCDINRHAQTLPEANNCNSPLSHTDKPSLLSCNDASEGHVFVHISSYSLCLCEDSASFLLIKLLTLM